MCHVCTSSTCIKQEQCARGALAFVIFFYQFGGAVILCSVRLLFCQLPARVRWIVIKFCCELSHAQAHAHAPVITSTERITKLSTAYFAAVCAQHHDTWIYFYPNCKMCSIQLYARLRLLCRVFNNKRGIYDMTRGNQADWLHGCMAHCSKQNGNLIGQEILIGHNFSLFTLWFAHLASGWKGNFQLLVRLFTCRNEQINWCQIQNCYRKFLYYSSKCLIVSVCLHWLNT